MCQWWPEVTLATYDVFLLEWILHLFLWYSNHPIPTTVSLSLLYSHSEIVSRETSGLKMRMIKKVVIMGHCALPPGISGQVGADDQEIYPWNYILNTSTKIASHTVTQLREAAIWMWLEWLGSVGLFFLPGIHFPASPTLIGMVAKSEEDGYGRVVHTVTHLCCNLWHGLYDFRNWQKRSFLAVVWDGQDHHQIPSQS